MRKTLRAILKRIAGAELAAQGRLDPKMLARLRASLSIYALVLVLLIWGLAVSYLVADRNRALEAAERELLNLAAGLNLQTEAMLADGVGGAMAVAARLEADGSLAAEDPERIIRGLRFELTGGEYIAALFIATPAGTYVFGRNDYQSFSKEQLEWQNPRPADAAFLSVGEPIQDPTHPGERVVPIARPFGSGTQRVLVGAWFDVEALHQRYASLVIGDGLIGLIGPNGRPLARMAFGSLQDIELSAPHELSEAEDRRLSSLRAQPRILIADSAAGGIKMIYGMSRPLPTVQLFVIVGRTWESVMLRARDRMFGVLIGACFASMLVVALTVFLYYHVSEIHRREALFRQLLDSSLISVFLLKNGRIAQANQRAAEMFRVPSATALLGLSPIDLSPPFQENDVPSAIAARRIGDRLIREGKVTFHWLHKRLDTGESFPSDTSLATIIADSQALTLVIARDVSELEQARKELQRANENLEQRVADRTAELERANAHLAAANQELEAFTAAASHDLRSPLSMISGQAGMLELELGDAASEQQRERVSRIHTGVRRAVGVIDGMLSLARISRQEIHREEVDLSELARQAIAELKESDPGREVVCRIDDALIVHADTRLMRSLLTNLIGNAWKYSRNNARVEIEFRAESGSEGRTFRISDRGAGFDMAHAKDLFLPFRRLHSITDFPGTGVGLAIVARVVNRYGGRIWAESAVGNGATFRFTLPLALDNRGADESADSVMSVRVTSDG